jgi:hypothetical protein
MEVKPMDNLAKQLKADAAAIDVQVSDELDRRIGASLQGITPEKPTTPTGQSRPPLFWWASSLTGIAVALAVIAIVNLQSQVGEDVVEAPEMSPVTVATTPIIKWNAESAMLTQPLQRELEDLQSDIKKAEEKVKQEIGL